MVDTEKADEIFKELNLSERWLTDDVKHSKYYKDYLTKVFQDLMILYKNV